MNLELIRKYEKEFLHMLRGGNLLYKLGSTKWYQNPQLPFSDDDYAKKVTAIIIDDEYVEYRKALAEGKTIQFFNTKERVYGSSKPLHTWQDIDKIHIQGIPSDYRIKLEEHKFKVGDWVENITCTSPRIIKKVVNAPEGYDTVTVGNSDVGINVMLINDLELWQPKEGEICIFWNDYTCIAVISKFSRMSSYNEYISAELELPYDNCMPFTGILPTHMKDNKCLH